MEVSLDSLIPFEKINTDADSVFEIVEKNGKVVLLRDNKPLYIIMKYDAAVDSIKRAANIETSKYTLQEAMRIVLSETVDNTIHAADLADETFNSWIFRSC